MARKKAPNLTEGELKIMRLVWDLGEATVSDVIEAMPKEKRPAYNTVLTIMRILEQKGYLRHVKAGRAHIYRPVVSQRQARRKAVRHMVANLFDNSPEQLLLSILENEKLSPAEIARLKQMIDSSR
jgi:predicted transcriptional regulator